MELLRAGILLGLAPILPRGDPAQDLHRAVSLPTPKLRREAALELAGRADVGVESWLETMAAFGSFRPLEPGPYAERIDGTEIHVFVPESYDPARPAPLLLALHWTHGSGRDLHRTWQSVAEGLGMLVLSPSDPGENVGYTFTPGEREQTLAALRWARLHHNVDENRIFATGISRGGHLAWDLALRHPDRFAAIAPMIGGPRILVAGGENNLRYLENVAHLPIRDLQGSKDDPILVFNLRLAFERLGKWKAPDARLIEFPELGHAFDPAAVDWGEFLGGAVRDPLPMRVVRTFAAPGEGRAFWVEVLDGDEDVEETFTPRVTRGRFEAMDAFERLSHVQGQADRRTARLEASRGASGRIKVKDLRVRSFRLLLPESMLRRGEAIVTWNGRTTRRKARPSKEVLLLDFVERFDRTFLPVVEVRLP